MKIKFKRWLRSFSQRCALAARKRTLMRLRAIVWRVDEWIQRQEVRLRKDLEFRADPKQSEPAAAPHNRTIVSGRQPETFRQWEARRSGVAVISKNEARRRRSLSAAQFDQRFA